MRNRSISGAIAALLLAFTLGACGGGSGKTENRQITVDSTQSHEKMIAAGHYDWVNDAITATAFPVQGKTKRVETMVIVSFNRSISSKTAVDEMRAHSLRPANLEECLAYGAALAKNRRDFDLGPPTYWTVCLGQSAQVGGDRYVPILWRGVGGRWGLGLRYWDGVWGSGNLFLAVRN
ncbi:MAG: hypothetical protein WDN10_01905 [bacterium]